MKKFWCAIIFSFLPALCSAESITPWAGHWSFLESWPDLSGTTNDYLSYKLTIPSDSSKTASLVLSGFQTYEHINLFVVSKDNELTFISTDKHQKMFKLTQNKQNTQTSWLKLKPVLDSNKKSGSYFKKD